MTVEEIIKLAEEYKEKKYNDYIDSKEVFGEEEHFTLTDMGGYLAMVSFCTMLNAIKKEELSNEK